MNESLQAARGLPAAAGARAPGEPGGRHTGPCSRTPGLPRRPVLCLLVVCILPWTTLEADRAPSGPSLVPQVAGNCYERIVREADGRVTGRQRIRVRDPTMGPRGVRARVDVVKFKTRSGEGGEPRVADRFHFSMIGDISKDAQKEETALQIVGYVGADSRVALDFLEETEIYPDSPCTGQSLPPVKLDLSARGGFVDLLGGRAEVRITERRCTPAEGGNDAYLISGVLRMKMYLLGIPFKKERYVSRQLVDPDRGLVRHVLEARDGGSQDLALVEPSACSPPWTRRSDE